jgi:hypothetical protein
MQWHWVCVLAWFCLNITPRTPPIPWPPHTLRESDWKVRANKQKFRVGGAVLMVVVCRQSRQLLGAWYCVKIMTTFRADPCVLASVLAAAHTAACARARAMHVRGWCGVHVRVACAVGMYVGWRTKIEPEHHHHLEVEGGKHTIIQTKHAKAILTTWDTHRLLRCIPTAFQN